MEQDEAAGERAEIRLGSFRFEPGRRRLRARNGDCVRLRRQSLDVLAVLAESPGEIVTKSRILDEVWAGVATTEDSLVQCIADIRRTLGRDVVETFPKQGYLLRTGPKQSARPARPSRWSALVRAAVRRAHHGARLDRRR